MEVMQVTKQGPGRSFSDEEFVTLRAKGPSYISAAIRRRWGVHRAVQVFLNLTHRKIILVPTFSYDPQGYKLTERGGISIERAVREMLRGREKTFCDAEVTEDGSLIISVT